MNPDIVYSKTPKGLEEMSQRTYKLPARMRTLLIMIDGKIPVAHLISRSPSPEEAANNVETLLRDGFIEAKGIGPSQAATADRPPVGVDPLEQAKKFMVQSMQAAIGPDADMFTAKIETARNMETLAELAPKYVEIVRAGGNAKKADAFRAGLIERGIVKDALSLPAGTPAPAAAPPSAEEARRLTGAKRVIAGFLLETLGPEASRFTVQVEAAKTPAELRQIAARHLETIRNAAGAGRAEEFRLRALEALNG